MGHFVLWLFDDGTFCDGSFCDGCFVCESSNLFKGKEDEFSFLKPGGM
jgi:hypothetical protein